jgi:hypothetical protein
LNEDRRRNTNNAFDYQKHENKAIITLLNHFPGNGAWLQPPCSVVRSGQLAVCDNKTLTDKGVDVVVGDEKIGSGMR